MGYNYQIVIQESTETRSSAGAVDTTWATYKTVWAERDDPGGGVSYEAEEPVYSDALAFKIHSHDAPDVTTKMRISYESDLYWIRSIRREGRFHFHLVTEAFDDE